MSEHGTKQWIWRALNARTKDEGVRDGSSWFSVSTLRFTCVGLLKFSLFEALSAQCVYSKKQNRQMSGFVEIRGFSKKAQRRHNEGTNKGGGRAGLCNGFAEGAPRDRRRIEEGEMGHSLSFFSLNSAIHSRSLLCSNVLSGRYSVYCCA